MKRIIAASVSLSLILVSAPLPAWSQVSSAMTGSASGVSGSAAGAARNGAIPQLAMPALSLTAPALSGALSAPMANSPVPGANRRAPISAASPVEQRQALAIAVPLAAEAPAPLAAATPQIPASKSAALSPVTADANSLAAARLDVAEAAGAIQRGPTSSSRWAAARMMDRLLGVEEAGEREPVVEGLPPAGILSAGLTPASASERSGLASVPSPQAPENAPGRSKLGGALKTVATFAAGAGLTIGLQLAAVALFPAIFGVVPVAAVWAVSSGLLLFPVALYARYRLAKRDSPRLNKVKLILDLSLGAFTGAALIAVPSLGLVLSTAGVLTAAAPLLAVAGGRWFGSNSLADTVLTWAVLGFTPAVVGVASAAGLIGLAPIVGLMMLPVMTTIAFFLGRLIHSAETGAPFSVPGSMQKIRFPSFQWVMIGVVFALLTGYSAVYTNVAFGVWTLLGGRSGNALSTFRVNSVWTFLKKILSYITFNRLYFALFAYTAFTGFASPLTFLVIAFAGERASVWTDKLLGRILPKAAPAPSARTAPVEDPSRLDDAPPKWPAFHYWAKSFLMLGSMAGIGVLLSFTVFGVTSLLTNLGIAAVLAFVPFFFAKKIIKLVMKAKPTTKEQDPEFFEIMEGLRDRINAGRRAKGKKEIPMPEMVIDPMDAPNAYATGRSPFAAMVGVTRGIKAMTLEPEIVRDGVVRLIASTDAGSKEFKVFRRAIAGSVTGVPADAKPSEVASSVLKADRSELKALGVRMLRGVLSHEFSHVMDRHMLSGSIGGAIASGVAFASYGVMWAVGHAKVMVQKALGLAPKEAAEDERAAGVEGPGSKTHAVDPISTGVILKSLPALLRLFAALWAPVVLQVLQMASSRNNEGMADEDGALLSEDPESLALALGLLTTWRPGAGFRLPGAAVPRAASLQHIMIVNPLEQLDNAGALPRTSASGGPTRADDLIFELFITHPNTGVRVRKLWDMSEAMRGTRPKPRPPEDGGGGGTKVSFAPQAGAASEKIGGGLLRGAWAKLKASLRVLPDEGRNRQFWIYTAGQALVLLGGNFHYTALPNLVAPAKEDAAKLGYNRAINWGAQAGASLATGPLVDRTSTQKVIIWTNLGRSALMLLVPVLFFSGYFGFALFTALVAGAGFLQMVGMTAGAVAFNRILAGDVAHYNRANAVSTIVMNVVGVVGPLLAGAFIAAVSAHFGLLSGNAMSYAVYGVLLLAAAVGYGLFLKLPRDEMMGARRELSVLLKRDGVGGAAFRGVTAGQIEGRPAISVEVDGDPSRAVVPAVFGGFAVRAVPRRRVLSEVAQGFKTIWADRFLRLYLLSTTVAVMSGDALLFAALPRFIADVLQAGPGSFGLFLAAAALGSGAGSGLMALLRDPEQMALAPSARAFRAQLAAREPALDEKALDGAAAAVRASVPALLARYKAEWAKGAPAVAAERFGADLVAEAARAAGAALGRSEPEALALLEATGAAGDLRAWSALRGAKLLARAYADATTGMNRLERQGKWTSWLHGFSWLAYGALFLTGNLHLAVGLMLLSTFLGAPGVVVWTSLTTKVVAGSYRENQGKIYSALYFYQLIFAIVGVLLVGLMMASLPTMTVLWITGAVMVLCALCDFIAPSLIFPIDRKKR
ncbi:MAG: MFS transporter [Elusimicrobiota bacterium]|nr:MFS transporter [Elusimicrobiota bacterium]